MRSPSLEIRLTEPRWARYSATLGGVDTLRRRSALAGFETRCRRPSRLAGGQR